MIPIDDRLIADLAERAALSPRRRQHLNLHSDFADPCQRLLNFLWRDSYIRPHRHSTDPKPETLIALRGEFGCLVFDDRGNIAEQVRIAPGSACSAVVVQPDEWHSIVALSATALLLEVKAGPFDPGAAKEQAGWAAEEGAAAAATYLQSLQRLFV